jgi:ketosteroid isomerase-like protein
VGADAIEILRRGYQAFMDGDVATVLEILHPEMEFEDHGLSPDTPTRAKGVEGFLETVADINEGLEDVRYTPLDFEEVGESVLVKAMRTGRGGVSGAPVEERIFHLWEVEGRQATRLRVFHERDQAVRAAAAASASQAG